MNVIHHSSDNLDIDQAYLSGNAMKIIDSIIIFLALLPLSAFGHPGHGVDEGVWHYVFSHGGGIVFVLFVWIAVLYRLLKTKNRDA